MLQFAKFGRLRVQSQTVIRTIKWIEDTVGKSFFEYIDKLLGRISDEKDNVTPFRVFMQIGQEVGRFGIMLQRNNDAVQVLQSFKLSILAEPDKLIPLLSSDASGGPDSRARTHHVLHETLYGPWRLMTRSREPWEALTVPEELREAGPHNDIVTIEIRMSGERTMPLPNLVKVSEYLESLYLTIARSYGIEHEGQLEILKVESGSDIRLDCKGVVNVIVHLKESLIEIWNKFRHKRADELLENNRALLASLAVMDEISARERDKVIAREEAEQLRRAVVKASLGLFECGALISEIPDEEVVSNKNLLTGFSPSSGTRRSSRFRG
jgi:hypothetical protein